MTTSIFTMTPFPMSLNKYDKKIFIVLFLILQIPTPPLSETLVISLNNKKALGSNNPE